METWIQLYRDLSDTKDQDLFLNTLVHHYAQLFDATDSGYLLLDERQNVLSHNDLAQELLGHKPAIGEPMPRPGDLFELEEGEGGSVIEQAFAEETPRQQQLTLRRNGERHWLRMTAIPLTLLSQRQALVVLQDTSAQKRLEADVIAKQELLDQARTRDPLTGLHNRRFILEELDRLNAQAKRYGTPFSVVLIDLDHFKSVNDTYGHDVADGVLLHLARLLERELRDADISARYGEEEFMVLLPETRAEAAVQTINRLRQHFMESKVPGIRRSLTLSAGVLEWEPGLSLEQVVFKTDQRLAMAKYAGRNQVCGDLYS